jgi:hypothetical protein
MEKKEIHEKIIALMNKNELLKSEFIQNEINFFKENIYFCNLNTKNKFGQNILSFVLNNNEYLKINDEQFNYLIKNSNIQEIDNDGWNILMSALLKCKEQKLNIHEKQWDYLIENSEINYNNKQYDDTIALLIALQKNKENQLNKKQLKNMYDRLDEIIKQHLFRKFIKIYQQDKKMFLEELNFLLYDCYFQPNKATTAYLSWEKDEKEIFNLIEKRDLFFKLNQDIDTTKNYQLKIKI